MRKSFLATVLLILCSAITLQAQEKNTLSSYRIFPKDGKDAALRKAIAAHAAKFHTGNWKWHVFSVVSGKDEGAYMINEGPNTWADIDGRKDISEAHTQDYETNVLPLVEKTLPNTYVTYQKGLSTDSVAGAFKNALLRHVYPKPGKDGRLWNSAMTWKKVWEKLGVKVTVWRSFFSGQPQIVFAWRLANGWADLDKVSGKEMRDAFDEFAGRGAYIRYQEDLDQYVDKIDEEMIEYRPEMSSK